jgi:hypothetical protein
VNSESEWLYYSLFTTTTINKMANLKEVIELLRFIYDANYICDENGF